MHSSVKDWCRAMVAKYGLDAGHVLEVGSFDVNGSVRPLFPACHSYIGVDIREGPGVDEVIERSWYRKHFKEFDTVICTEVLEHEPRPWRLIEDMVLSLKMGGYLVLTCRGFDERGAYGIHDYPGDYWRPHMNAICLLFDDAGLEIKELEQDPDAPGIFAVGFSPV